MDTLKKDDIDVDLSVFWYSLLRFGWIVIITMMMGFFLGVGVLKLLPKVYETKATFFLADLQQEGGLGGSVSALLGGAAGGGPNLQRLIPEFVKSQSVFLGVATQLKMTPLELKAYGLSVEDDMKSGLFKITISGTSPERLPEITAAYLDQINQLNLRLDMVPQRSLIKILDFPEMPVQPVRPIPIRVKLMGAIGGAVLGFGMMLFLGMRKTNS